jgi:two-component system, LytTR family, response regulator
MTRRALVVDDERLARVELCSMLAKHPGVAVAGEAFSVESAIERIGALRPDLVFLDIQLGDGTGFEVLERIPVTFDVVFVTAYDAHALKAFEVNAIDYLLKPVNAERLTAAIQRLDAGSPHAPAHGERDTGTLEKDDRIFVRANTGWRFLEISTIRLIEAAGDFTRLYLSDGSVFLLGKSLREWEDRLPARSFVRIHRSVIVNLSHVVKVDEWSGQTFHVHVKGIDTPFPMSRRYAARLRQ